MPGLVKVGYSMKDPALRAEELDHTGSPHPYIVDYEVLVNEPRDIEQKVHSHLKSHKEGKEWFRCSSEEAIATIQTVVGSSAQIENFKRADRERSMAIRKQKEDEAQARKAEKKEQQMSKAEIERQRSEIYKLYDPQLNEMLAQTKAYIYVGSVFTALIVSGLVVEVFFNIKDKNADGWWIILSIILFFVLISYGKKFFIEEKKQSLEYKDLIAERDKEVATLYNNRGVVYADKGQHDRAIDNFNKALELNPNSAKAYNNRGITYGNKGQHDMAIADFQKACDMGYEDSCKNLQRALGKR